MQAELMGAHQKWRNASSSITYKGLNPHEENLPGKRGDRGLRIGGYEIPSRLLYMKEHTWLSIEGHDLGRIGVTDYLQRALREISFIYLPKNGLEIRRLQAVATVESIKALSEIYSPISGRIIDVNRELISTPGLINQDPYVKGWVAVIQSSTLGEEASKLLEAKQYAEYMKKLVRMDKPHSHGSHSDSQ